MVSPFFLINPWWQRKTETPVHRTAKPAKMNTLLRLYLGEAVPFEKEIAEVGNTVFNETKQTHRSQIELSLGLVCFRPPFRLL